MTRRPGRSLVTVGRENIGRKDVEDAPKGRLSTSRCSVRHRCSWRALHQIQYPDRSTGALIFIEDFSREASSLHSNGLSCVLRRVAGARRGSAAYPPIAAVPGGRGNGRVGPTTDIASASTIQKHSDLRAQFAEGERLADHMHAGVDPAMMDDGVARIARREKHPQSGPAAYGFVGKLTAIHAAGHDHVREQQIYGMTFENS